MAMEKAYMIREAHTRSITAVGFNPVRRELLLGSEDGVVKSFELDSGKFVASFYEHKGWVTDFLFWSETKLNLSSSNDGEILAWGIGGGVTDRVKIGIPVFCLAILPRRHQILCGVKGAIRVYALDDDRESGHVINARILYQAREHTDLVRCIVCLDNKVICGGYDNKLIIYDSSVSKSRLVPVLNIRAHTSGITCLNIASDLENTWVLTGSFDKALKIWTMEGTLMQVIDNFPGTVTGVIYVPRNKTVWVAAGAPYAWLYEPKSGDKVSDFIGTFQNVAEEKYHLQILKYFPELNQAVASTSRRQLIVWKYNSGGCITAFKCSCPIESLCYTAKNPILIFSGDHEGNISKWERNQSNHFMYTKETFHKGDLEKVKVAGGRASQVEEEKRHTHVNAAKYRKMLKSSYAYNKHTVPPLSIHEHPNTTILKILFIESLDCLLAASEDGNIYMWGFDVSAVQALQSMRPEGIDDLVKQYGVLLDPSSPLLDPNSKEDSVTNRVAGFTCKMILAHHVSCVTSLVTVERCFRWNSTYVLSGSWDRRVCLWDIEAGSLKAVCGDFITPHGSTFQAQQLACDGIINDMAFSPKNLEFACASSDKMVYIRKFSLNGARMHLVNTLQGHEAEVTAVEWSSIYNKWVTGSEDGTVRIWNGIGLNECEQTLNVTKGVTCLCVDQFVGTVVVGVQNDIRVYEPENYCQVQNNLGHGDAVRTIIHIPDRYQYVSCAWDSTIRVWNAWKPLRSKRKEAEGPRVLLGGKVKQMLAQKMPDVTRKVALSIQFAAKLHKVSGLAMTGESDPVTAETLLDMQEQQEQEQQEQEQKKQQLSADSKPEV